MIYRQEITVDTPGRGFTELTNAVRETVAASGIADGLCTLFITHTSASLFINENADPQVLDDLERFMARLVPDGDVSFMHTAEGPDDMPSHLRSAVTKTSENIPVVDGRLGLGTWQGLYLWEHRDSPHRRTLIVHILGE